MSSTETEEAEGRPQPSRFQKFGNLYVPRDSVVGIEADPVTGKVVFSVTYERPSGKSSTTLLTTKLSQPSLVDEAINAFSRHQDWSENKAETPCKLRTTYEIGDKVAALDCYQHWYLGTIVAIKPDNHYEVAYSGCSQAQNEVQPFTNIRLQLSNPVSVLKEGTIFLFTKQGTKHLFQGTYTSRAPAPCNNNHIVAFL